LHANGSESGRRKKVPEKKTIKAAREDKRKGKSASTQAGEFVREEVHHIRAGKHGARSTKQAIAIGLSKARRAGVELPVPKAGKASKRVRAQARRDAAVGRRRTKKVSARRSRAMLRKLRREGHSAASHSALSRHAHQAAMRRTASARSASAKKAARTKGPRARAAAARKAARTRATKPR
jgi:hypothetical protein